MVLTFIVEDPRRCHRCSRNSPDGVNIKLVGFGFRFVDFFQESDCSHRYIS